MINTKPISRQASPLKTLWLIVASCGLVLDTCIRCIVLSVFGKVTRPWVNHRMKVWSKQMMNLWHIHCSVHNPHHIEPIPGQPTIIMCNHSSLFDIPITYRAFPDISLRMLAKKEMSKLPLMGKAMHQAEFPFVDRKNRHQAIKDLKIIHQMLENGIVIWIAPEGTRSQDRHVGPFKKGGFITAIQTKATIIPIGVRGAYDILPSRTLKCFLNQNAEVHIGEPIDASKFTLDNKDELIQQTHAAIQALVGDNRAYPK